MVEVIADYLPLLFGLTAALAVGVAVFVPALRNPFLSVLVLVASLPFERVPSLDIGGVTLRFNQLAAVIVIAVAILALVFDRRQIRLYPALLPLLGFFLLTMWTTPAAANVARAASVFVFVLLMAITSLMIPQVVTDKSHVKQLGILFTVLAAFVSLFALFQFFGEMIGLPERLTFIREGYGKEVFGFPRVHAFSAEPLYFANFLFLPLGAMVGLLLTRQDVVPRTWLLGSLGATLLVFLLALSRGAFIAAVPFTIMIVIFFLRRFLTVPNILGILLGLLLVGATVWGILGIVSPEARERYLGHATLQDVLVTREGESAFGRLTTFERAVEIWGRSPVWGVGLGNYGPSVAQDPLTVPEHGWDIVNNQYLESLTETGIVGLGLLLLFWGLVVLRSFIAFYKTRDLLVRAFLGGLTAAFVATLVQYNFFSTLYIMHIWVAIGLLVALQNIALAPERKVSHAS